MNVLTFGVFVFTGALIIALAIPLIQRRIGPNSLYGLRVPATFADEGVWYDANERSGRDLAAFGVGQLAVAAGLLPLGLPEEAYALVNTGYAIAGALVCAVIGWRRANAMLSDRAPGAHPGDRPGQTG